MTKDTDKTRAEGRGEMRRKVGHIPYFHCAAPLHSCWFSLERISRWSLKSNVRQKESYFKHCKSH
jgi:hypothetical protein